MKAKIKSKSYSFVWGILGGIIGLGVLFLLSLFVLNLHIYNVQIINDKNIDKIEKYKDKILIIKEMQKDGILLTPQEYTSGISNYYNTAISLLVFLFILFSITTYFHLKFLSKEQIEEQILKLLDDKIRDSKEMEQIIMSAFVGKADDKYETIENVDELRERLDALNSRIDRLPEDEELVF